MSSHTHSFTQDEWKFDCAQNTATFCTEKVRDPEYFIEEVYHDHDGDWQFFHNGGDSTTKPKLLCMGCVCDFDPSVMQLHDMPSGWFAYRDSLNQKWSRKRYDRQEEEE